MRHRRQRPDGESGVEVRDHGLVELLAEHLPQFDVERLVHGFASGERLGRLGAPPREVVAALAPPLAPELGERRDHRAVVLLVVDTPQRELPADLGLPVTVVLADAHRVLVQRAARDRRAKPTRLRKMQASFTRRVRQSGVPSSFLPTLA